MIGLIRKDFINLKKYGKQIGIMLAAFLVFGIAMKSPLYVCFMMMLYGTMTILTAMAYDEKADFDKYALCLPVSRRDLVKSKYLVWFIIMFGAFSISSITGAVLNLIFAQGNIPLLVFVGILLIIAAVSTSYMSSVKIVKKKEY